MARRNSAVGVVLMPWACSARAAPSARARGGRRAHPGSAHPILVTRDWGVVDGMLSVVVRNTTDRTLRSATAVITARDRNDVLISSSLEAPDGCCAVTDLPPGQEFGFYVDVGDAATESAGSTSPTATCLGDGRRHAPSPLDAQPVRLDGNGKGAVVVAEVRSSVNDGPAGQRPGLPERRRRQVPRGRRRPVVLLLEGPARDPDAAPPPGARRHDDRQGRSSIPSRTIRTARR